MESHHATEILAGQRRGLRSHQVLGVLEHLESFLKRLHVRRAAAQFVPLLRDPGQRLDEAGLSAEHGAAVG